MDETNNSIFDSNSKTIGKFDKNIYDYIKSQQTSRLKCTVLTLITVGILVANEYQFFNSCFSFTVLGCKNITSGYDYSIPYTAISLFSTVSQSEYSIETCINGRVQYCIPLQYTVADNLNASFSFSITKEYWSHPFYLKPNLESDHTNIYYGAFIFFCILVSLYLLIIRLQYVTRSRAHLLLSLNVVLIPSKRTIIGFLIMFITIILCSIFYSFGKYTNIIALYNDASIIYCDSDVMELYFEGKTTSSIFQIVLNFAVFMFIFKDLVSNVFDGTSFYDEMKLINLIKSKDSLNSMDRLKELKSITDQDLLNAVELHIDIKYPIGSISYIKRIALTRFVFLSFFLTKADIIPIIEQHYKYNPNVFVPFIPTTTNDNDDDDDQNQHDQSITIAENAGLLN